MCISKEKEGEKGNPCGDQNNGRDEGTSCPAELADQGSYKETDNSRYNSNDRDNISHISIELGRVRIELVYLVLPHDFDQVTGDIVSDNNDGDANEIF